MLRHNCLQNCHCGSVDIELKRFTYCAYDSKKFTILTVLPKFACIATQDFAFPTQFPSIDQPHYCNVNVLTFHLPASKTWQCVWWMSPLIKQETEKVECTKNLNRIHLFFSTMSWARPGAIWDVKILFNPKSV